MHAIQVRVKHALNMQVLPLIKLYFKLLNIVRVEVFVFAHRLDDYFFYALDHLCKLVFEVYEQKIIKLATWFNLLVELH